MVAIYDLKVEVGIVMKLLAVFLGLLFEPIATAAHTRNRRYMFPEITILLENVTFIPDPVTGPAGKVVIPTTVPFVTGLTEVSFSNYQICSEQCDGLLINVTETCDGCLVRHQRGSYVQMAKWQLSADVLIALAYFSIPLELLYFLYRMRIFPYKLVVAQFGLFIILCGLTHIITVWTFTANSKASFATMTFFKCITAFVSCATAVTLFQVIPELLSVKTREIFLTMKTAELGKEVGKIKKQEEIGRHVRLLTHEIRSTLDRHTILYTTLVETARTLHSKDCGIWMPNLSKQCVELTYSVETSAVISQLSVPLTDETVQKIFSASGAIVIPKDSALARLTLTMSSDEEMLEGHVAGLRLPLLHTTDFNRSSSVNVLNTGAGGELALMVLALPNNEERQWGAHELELLNSVVDQKLIDDVLDFSKLEVGKLTLDLIPSDLTSLFKEAENILRPMAQSKQIGFDWTLKNVPEMILGDSKRILQILLNVIGNAIKFTSTGYVNVTVEIGEIVDVQPPGLEQPSTPTKRKPRKVEYKYIHVTVEDTGVGISSEHVSGLFNKFVQADSSTARKFGGTGLGLAICKKFVELMHGSISIESGGVGKGSTCKFKLCVGVISKADERSSPLRQSLTEGSLAGTKVLVVDDNAINRMVTNKLLRTLGCEATVLESGPECLQKLAEVGPSAFDILLLDLCMPDMDGFMVATEIIKTYGHKKLLISALTANADARTREKCFEIGMDGILLKPISLKKMKEDLLKLIEHANDFDVNDVTYDLGPETSSSVL